MINRLHQIKSALAERKMFAGGGMVSPGMPQGGMVSPGMPQGGMMPPPQGILASSPDMIDAATQEFLSAAGLQTGNPGPMPMAQGGLVESENMMAQGYDDGGFATTVGTRTNIGLGANAEDMAKRALMTPSELSSAMFPYEAGLKGGAFGAQKSRPGAIGLAQEPGRTMPLMDALKVPLNIVDQAARTLSQANAAAANILRDVGTFALTGKPQETDYSNFYGQIQAVNSLLRRMPKIKGVSDEVLYAEIGDLAKSVIAKTPNISGDELSSVVSTALLDKYEAGYARAEAADQDEGEAMTADSGYDNNGNWIGDGPEPVTPPIGTAAPEIDVVERTDLENEIDNATEPPTAGAPAAGAPAAGTPAAGTPAPEIDVVERTDLENEIDTAADNVKKTFNQQPNITKAAATKTMADYIAQFKKDMPKYEGMSDEEKGWLGVEAGLRIMAGQSPDAITNIASGLKGWGAELAKDAKEKRAWNRQVELSAAKYGLEAVAKDKAIEQADVRKLFFFYDQSPGKVTKNTPYGQQVAISRQQLMDWGGELPPNLVEGDLVSKNAVSLGASAKNFKKNILANYKDYKITAPEAAKIRGDLDDTLKTFRQAEAGINLLGMAKARIAKMGSQGSSIGSFGAAFNDQLNRVANMAEFSSLGWSNRFRKGKYIEVALAKSDVNMALQALIKADLGSTQSANSISNFDVRLLADAYVDSAFQEDGSWNFLGLNSEVLGKKLDGAIAVFRNKQNSALGAYDSIINRFDTAERKFAILPGLGISPFEMDQGPFRRSAFETRLKNISPYVQALRRKGDGAGGVVSNTGKISRQIVTSEGVFNLNDKNKFVFTPKAP